MSKTPWSNLFVSSSTNDPDLTVCYDQALSQKEAEKAAITEKLAALQQDLATAGMELECMQREALSKQEQEKVKIRQRHIGCCHSFSFFIYHSAGCSVCPCVPERSSRPPV